MFNTFLLALLAAMLTNNIVLTKALGLNSFFEVSNKGRVKPVIVTTIYLTIILFVSALIYYPIYVLLLVGANMLYLKTLFAGLITLLTSCVVFKVANKVLPEHLRVLKDQQMFVAINTLLVGFLLLSVSSQAGYLVVLFEVLGTGLGFGLVGLVFTTIRYRLEISSVPKAFKGLPIALITAGIMAMAFAGLAGLV